MISKKLKVYLFSIPTLLLACAGIVYATSFTVGVNKGNANPVALVDENGGSINSTNPMSVNVESVLLGEDESASQVDLRATADGALIFQNLNDEILLGHFPTRSLDIEFGRNTDVDTTTDPEDIWSAGGLYTGFNATADEDIEVFSGDADDVGTTLSSGTATGGSATTLVDSLADFVTDTVAVGDALVNDTKGAHGIITNVDVTTLTVSYMVGEANTSYTNEIGDVYRVVHAGDTGGALVRLENNLNSSFADQGAKYVVLNGATGVTVTGNFMRSVRANLILAGATGSNEGDITVRQATTTANVFSTIPTGFNQSYVGADTVPANKTMIIKKIRLSIAGTGSATISLRVRNKGEVFRAIRAFTVTTTQPVEYTPLGGELVMQGADVKLTVDEVSNDNTVVDGALEYELSN